MTAMTFRFKHTVHHRIPTLGGMDSEPGPTTVEDDELTVVVPRDDEWWEKWAGSWVTRYGGNSYDPNFIFVGPIEKRQIHGILSEVRLVD